MTQETMRLWIIYCYLASRILLLCSIIQVVKGGSPIVDYIPKHNATKFKGEIIMRYTTNRTVDSIYKPKIKFVIPPFSNSTVAAKDASLPWYFYVFLASTIILALIAGGCVYLYFWFTTMRKSKKKKKSKKKDEDDLSTIGSMSTDGEDTLAKSSVTDESTTTEPLTIDNSRTSSANDIYLVSTTQR